MIDFPNLWPGGARAASASGNETKGSLMSATDKVGVGIIGLSAKGSWSAAAHLPALAALDGYELRALSASSPDSAKAAGELYGVPLVFDSAEKLAQHPDVDLVVVTVKVPRHDELIRPALEAGKMVLCEWPLAANPHQAEELSALAGDIRTAVGLQERSAPALRYLRDMIADGYLGEVLSTTLTVSGVGWGETYQTHAKYTLDPANGATMLTVPFAHVIDTLTMVLGDIAHLKATTAIRRPVVYDAQTGEAATANAPDQIAVTATLKSGVVATTHMRGGTSRASNFRWEINGTDGDIVVTAPEGALLSRSLTLYGARGADTELAELPVPASYVRVLAGQSDEFAYHIAHSYLQLHDDITSGGNVVPDFAHAVRLHKLLDDVTASADRDQ